jgi:acetyl-CoA carboxylase biotin carboxyl carrier protein
MVGTFYRAPGPDAEPFVEVGQHIEPDTTVCIIEVMKLMNSIAAETRGVVAEILVENGARVDFGDVLMVIGPDPEDG